MDLTEEQHERLRQGALDFKRAMEVRSGLNLRVAIRVTAMLRVGMVSLAVIAATFFLILLTLNSRMTFMLETMGTMNQQFMSMTKDMHAMREAVVQMDQSVSKLPVIVDEVGIMRGAVANLNQDIVAIAGSMGRIQGNMQRVTQNVDNMTSSFRVLDPNVQGIGMGVNRIARPMKFFNSVSPYP